MHFRQSPGALELHLSFLTASQSNLLMGARYVCPDNVCGYEVDSPHGHLQCPLCGRVLQLKNRELPPGSNALVGAVSGALFGLALGGSGGAVLGGAIGLLIGVNREEQERLRRLERSFL